MAYNPRTGEYSQDPHDRLGLSLRHRTCDICRRLYPCFSDLEFHARECADCRALRVALREPTEEQG